MKRIAYVEDDPVNALVVRKFLEQDFEVFHFPDGESFLDFVPRTSIDMVLMDINLGRGKKDGLETLQAMRILPLSHQPPVMAVTAYAMPEDEMRFLSAGFDAYLAKPVDREVLLKTIRRMLI